jgi:hypothetical protein
MTDRHRRRYLRRFSCFLCEQRLDRINKPGDCCAIAHRCDQATIDRRRDRCLEGHKPRPLRRRRLDHPNPSARPASPLRWPVTKTGAAR